MKLYPTLCGGILLLGLLASPLSAQSKLPEILDYSYCGYHASEDSIPLAPVRAYVACAEGDMSATIQAAIDYVGSLPIGKEGLRGAVLLGPGTFQLDQRLVIPASGVVLRGSGREVTVLRKMGVDRGSLIRIEGKDLQQLGTDTLWVNASVKVGDKELSFRANNNNIKVGDEVIVTRQSSAPWIEAIGCRCFGGGIDASGWKPGDADLNWRRTVTAIGAEGRISLDAPITMGFDPNATASYIDNKKRKLDGIVYSPCFIRKVSNAGEVHESGIENLTIDSWYNTANAHDENHCWTGISVDQARDCWVRLVNFHHLAGSGVILQPQTSRITVQDCQYLEPVSENAGHRRTSFYVMGQQCLVERCYSRQGRHDFVTGTNAAGPNAFVQCEAAEALSYSGGLNSWACGTLFDIVDIDGHDLVLKNVEQGNNGTGWTSASSTLWNCTASDIYCYSPDTINLNRAYGAWAQFFGNGEWTNSNGHMNPRSLYYAQLSQRLGYEGDATRQGHPLYRQARILYRSTDASSSPTVEKAQEMAQEARNIPRQTLQQWIIDAPALPDWATSFEPNNVKGKKNKSLAIKQFSPIDNHSVAKQNAAAPIEIINGHLTYEQRLLIGGRYNTPWWNGSLRPTFLRGKSSKPALTRFVPDREGTGLTDRIDSVVAWVERNNILAWDQNYGLWYDRRRDDHERIRRRDADTWAPFWEQPWGRTGEGSSWNGLSLYDLTQNNTWYYDRLHQYAEQVAPMGKLLYLEHYFQHNILEAGAHWVDSPWRPTNNVNQTVFPEPVPFAGDKRVFVAEWFYDEQNATMRELHRQYIRRNLEAFRDLPNVIHYISEEYTGPLHFTQFWVETIRDWEQETGQHVLVALAATKDVQDAILADPALAPTIDIIDIRYWHYKTKADPSTRNSRDDGKDIYDPQGGVNLAPRQHARIQPVGKVTFSDAYRSVSEYRQRYPEKAVCYYAQNYPDMAWAVQMAGGSGAGVQIADIRLREQLPLMQISGALDRDDAKVLQSGDAALVYGLSDGTLSLADLAPGSYLLSELDASSGLCIGKPQALTIKAGQTNLHIKPRHIYWLRRK